MLNLSKETLSFIKNNKNLIQRLIETNDFKEYEYDKDFIFNIADSFLKNNPNSIIIMGETSDKISADNYIDNPAYFVTKFNDDAVAILRIGEQEGNDIFLVRRKSKIIFVGNNIEDIIPCLKEH